MIVQWFDNSFQVPLQGGLSTESQGRILYARVMASEEKTLVIRWRPYV